MAKDTVLKLVGMGIAPFSARGLTQTLTPISQAAVVRRTINGVLRDLSDTAFQKYASTISCEDLQAPALDGIWPGMQLEVHCVAELKYEVPDPEEDPIGEGASRPMVADSLVTRNGFRYYRPVLQMRVMNIDYDKDEFQAVRGWQLDLEEI